MQTKNACKIFFGNVCLSAKINLRLKNCGNFNVTWKNFGCRHQKKAGRTIFIYGNCMRNIFFQKKTSFFTTRLFYLVQTAAETISNFFQ